MFGIFSGYSRPETEHHHWVASLAPYIDDRWKYSYDLQPDFVKRKAPALMAAHLGMSWREAVDLVYKRRRDAIARVARARRIAESRAIDPR